MKAHTRLWIDHRGRLCDQPPTSGVMIATGGGDIAERFVRAHDLTVVDGKVVQRTRPTLSPDSTPEPLVADRLLYVTADGGLVDRKPKEGGVKIASKGEKIPRGYVTMHNLEVKDGKIIQKSIPKPPDKARRNAPNKGGFSVTTNGVTHSSGDASAEDDE